MRDTKTKWTIRKVQQADISFIYDSWMKSNWGYERNNPYRGLRETIYKSNYCRIIDYLLYVARIKVACLPEDELVILGYLVYEQPNIVHYCYVKEPFWFSGIARDLVDVALGEVKPFPVTCTHISQNVKAIMEKYSELTYNPYLLYKEIGDE